MPDTRDDIGFAADFDPTDPSSYAVWTRDVLRWGDTDALGHINNVEFARFFESGRIAFLGTAGRRGVDADDFLLAHLAIDFHAQMHFPGEVRTGSRVIRIGRSSVRFAQALFQDSVCTASGIAIVVMADRKTGRPVPVPQDMRSRLLDPGA
jgi:acyl-CoA thioester hydrolase